MCISITLIIMYFNYVFQLSYCDHTIYHIEQTFGGKKNWRNCDFETLAEKTLANPRLACIFVLHRECWRKKLGELWRFAKFAKVLFYTVAGIIDSFY